MPRSGFTLLEMILALVIGVVILGCFYSVLNYQVQQAQSGRLMLHEATLARSILTRMSNEILGTLPAINSFVQPNSTPSTTPSTSTVAPIVFNNMVYGETNVLVLAVSKVPAELNLTGALGKVASADPTLQATISDLRRISYWMTDGGLARQELKQATTNDLNYTPPDVPDPTTYTIIAPEVKDISFQYFDGMSWQDSWDGTTLGGGRADYAYWPTLGH